MATIKYDGQTRPSNLITYTDIPNILKVVDTGGGTYTTYTITLSGNLSSVTTKDGQWYISLLGETITNVTSPENAISKNFFIASANTSTAASICRALRNCSSIAANFVVRNSDNTIILTARAIGSMLSQMQFTSSIPSNYINGTGTDGSASSGLYGAKIDVDVYSDNEYITTLEKNYYGSEVAFNLSPVLTTISKHGETTPYDITISKIDKNGNYGEVGSVSTNYSVVGYMVNQGNKYNVAQSDITFAQNVTRGSNRDVLNNSLLYVYEPTIPISFYTTRTDTIHININYRDSDFTLQHTNDWNITGHGDTNILHDVTVNLNQVYLLAATYVDLEFEDLSEDNVIRYNVLKPLKATEYCQRLYFRNSYGGISFFDFTGTKTETRDLDVMTYEKNIFDYYTSDMNDLEKVYDNTVKYTVTLKSHLFEKDGKYIFNDMLQSPVAWVIRNSEKYAIIIDSINVEETSNNNDIYEATLKYHYSQEPSLI